MFKEELAETRLVPGVEGIGLEVGEGDLSFVVLLRGPRRSGVPMSLHGCLEVSLRRGLRGVGDVVGVEPILKLLGRPCGILYRAWDEYRIKLAKVDIETYLLVRCCRYFR